MTRDARLSALHRGDFRPGAALPSPALPPDPCSELLAARSSCLAGGVPDLPSPRLRAAAAGRHSPLRLQDRLRKTPLLKRGWESSSMNSLRSQVRSRGVAEIDWGIQTTRRLPPVASGNRRDINDGVEGRVTPGAQAVICLETQSFRFLKFFKRTPQNRDLLADDRSANHSCPYRPCKRLSNYSPRRDRQLKR